MSKTQQDAAKLREQRLETARQCARDLSHDFGVGAPEHIRLEGICADLGVRLLVVKLDGCDAQLVHDGKRATILLADRIADPHARRFSIAHELGHLLLKHPLRIPSRIPGPEAPRSSLDEAEANAFASELLMPERLIRGSCDLTRGDLDGPREIARNYNVSILAAAIRFTELAREPCAAVFSIRSKPGTGKVKWVVPSQSFTPRIARGRTLAPMSIASMFYRSGELDTHQCMVPSLAWFDGLADGDLLEHAISSPELRTVLSMLWIRRAA